MLRKRIRVKKGGPEPRLTETPRKALFYVLCLLATSNVPGPAWGQYSSGGYSRTGGATTYGYSAPSRRPPVSSSSGYSRRSYGGDQAFSRSLSSQALRDYQAAQRPVETYTRRPPAYAGGYNWAEETPRRPSIWEGQQPVYGAVRAPALPGSGPLTAVALWAALNSLSSPSSAQYFHNYQNDPGYVQWRREADREAAHHPAVAAKLDQLDSQLAQMEGQPRNPAAAPPAQSPSAPRSGSGFIWPVLFVGIVILLLLWLWRRRISQPSAAA